MRLAALLILTVLALPCYARDPSWGGLGAVAVSPDGKTVVTGGENRTLYVLDASTLEVKARIWTMARVGNLVYSQDGSKLFLEDDDEVLHIFDTATWKETSRVEDAGYIAPAPAADLLVAIGSRPKPCVRILSMKDGSEKAVIPVAKSAKCVGVDAEGKKAFAFLQPISDGPEKRADSKDMPKELKGAAKKEWERRNDGQMATIVWIDVAAGKSTGEAQLWFHATDGDHGFVAGGEAYVLGYQDACARINDKGDVAIFEITESYNYGKGASRDGRMMAGGGLRSGALLPAGGAAMKFELDRLPGWPEYWAAFTFGPDGTVWGVTSASRLVKVGADGKIAKAVPVH